MNYLSKPQSNSIRIIGGIHRGRKLSFPNVTDLRPTGDRMRETLFNWLQPKIYNAKCLDLFAGSGALGFEAASRGAKQVIMLDTSLQAITQLQHNVSILRLAQVKVYQADALKWLQNTPSQTFDIIFLDPPFATNFILQSCNSLLQYKWLDSRSLLYLETNITLDHLPLPSSFSIIKKTRMGQVWCGLAQCAIV